MATSHSLNPGAKIQHEPDAGMNAQNLLLHFDRISDTPDAVSHLRRFVLDLAVRGKLVPQDPGDEPASELVKELARKKARLLNGGKLTNKKEILEGSPVQMLRTAPSTWTRTRLGDVSNVVMGQSPPGETYNTRGDGVPLINGPVEFSEGPFGITVKNQYTTAPTNFCGKGDLLICVRGSTTGRSNVAGFDACIGRGVAAIQPLFDDGFVRLFLWSMRDELIGMGRGIAFPSITRKQLENFPISLPPLAEQHRIVAKVDELMALCDRLEAARTERETDRNRLAAASLARLNAPDPDPAVFRKDAAFTLGNLTPLATRPDQIKALRQTILNLAVRGKLVPQDPNDKPTRELPKRMALMKAELLTDGKFKTLNVDLPRDDASFPFSLPESWIWCYMDDVGAVARGGSPRPIKSYLTDDPAGIPWIKIGDSVRGNIYIENTKERIRAE
ncbi:MAG: restriction endonuclease subunit S, partial [Candidatus Tectomicrobia bacterium]|nr:restriction endonuclease subunit S [Candidatus Tectomicrobia bacterium]